MRNVHDVGGILGFGSLPADDGKVFHAGWERAALGLTLAAMGNRFIRSVDENRHAKERMEPDAYLGSSYYELWVAALELGLVESGAFTEEELLTRTQEFLDEPDRDTGSNSLPSLNDALVGLIEQGAEFEGEADGPPKFAVGDRVRVRRTRTRRHTRTPHYVQGCLATVHRVTPAFALPDSIAHEYPPRYEHTYQLLIDGEELWGDSADASSSVLLDAFESYLQPIECLQPNEGSRR